MTPTRYFAKPWRSRIFVLGVLLALLVSTPDALADLNCHYFMQDGWHFAMVCVSEFDANGNYTRSMCHMDQYEDPYGNSHAMCKPGLDEGTCTGGNCTWAPGCTWTGACSTDLDCCGVNVCNMSTHRCEEPAGGGGFGGGGGGGGGWGGGGCISPWDCFAGEDCCSGSCQQHTVFGCLDQ
jgi:hypothetical protein